MAVFGMRLMHRCPPHDDSPLHFSLILAISRGDLRHDNVLIIISPSSSFTMFSATSATSSLRQMSLRLAARLSRASAPATTPSFPSSSRSIAHVCSHSHSPSRLQALSRNIPQSAILSRIQTVQVRGFKVRSSVKKLCESCFVVRR